MPPRVPIKKALAAASGKAQPTRTIPIVGPGGKEPVAGAGGAEKCTEDTCIIANVIKNSAPKKKEPLTSPKTSLTNDTFYQRYGIRLNSDYHLAETECNDIFEAILISTTKNFETTSDFDRRMLLTTLRKELTECYRGYYLRHLSEAYRQNHSLESLKLLLQEDDGTHFDTYLIDFIGKRIGRRIVLLEHASRESGVFGYEVQKVGHTGSWRESPTELGGVSFALPPEHIYYIILSKTNDRMHLIHMQDREDHRYYLFPGTHYVIEQINRKE